MRKRGRTGWALGLNEEGMVVPIYLVLLKAMTDETVASTATRRSSIYIIGL